MWIKLFTSILKFTLTHFFVILTEIISNLKYCSSVWNDMKHWKLFLSVLQKNGSMWNVNSLLQQAQIVLHMLTFNIHFGYTNVCYTLDVAVGRTKSGSFVSCREGKGTLGYGFYVLVFSINTYLMHVKR